MSGEKQTVHIIKQFLIDLTCLFAPQNSNDTKKIKQETQCITNSHIIYLTKF
jgi:hypothetical protein